MQPTTLLAPQRCSTSAPPPQSLPRCGPSPVATTDQLFARMLPCRAGDPELWFAEHTAQVEQAKALCRTCPVVGACLAGAVERAEPWGVWGGEVFVAGVVVPTKRGRGRPPKNKAVA